MIAVTACALYIISVSYEQIELPPKLPPLGTQDWIHWYVRRSNWLAFRLEPFAICSATRLIASTQVRHVRFWLTINQRNPIVWRVARCLVERAINAQLHHQHPATTSLSNPNTRWCMAWILSYSALRVMPIRRAISTPDPFTT